MDERLNKRTSGLVSIIVPCYNRELFIIDCLESLVKQTYTTTEIIIVNDGSTDNTLQVVRTWLHTAVDPDRQAEIIVVDLPRTSGFAGAVTTGMFLAKGEFLAMQDSDDLSHPERIKKQVDYLNSQPDIGLVGTNYAYFTTGSFDMRKRANWLCFGTDKIQNSYSRGQHCVCYGTTMFRGELFDRYGGMKRRSLGVEDYDFVANLASKNIAMDNIPEDLYFYRKHPDQRSRIYLK